MKLRSGKLFNENNQFLQCLQEKIIEQENQNQVKIQFKEEFSQLIHKIKKCKVKRNHIHYIIHTLNYLETKIPVLVENKKHTKKIFEWLNVLERQSYHSRSIQRYEIRTILLLRNKTNQIKKQIMNSLL
jgi:hypothetical protein